MAEKESLRLKIAGRKDFIVLHRILFLLAVIAAALSPQPALLTLFILVLIGAGWISRILCFHKVNDVELTLGIFAGGRIRLKSNCGGIDEGFLDGQQWCTRRIAVLRITTESKTQNLIVLSGQQTPDEYRRLKVWLRQGAALLLKSEGRV